MTCSVDRFIASKKEIDGDRKSDQFIDASPHFREGNISATAFLEPFELTSWILILVVCVHAVGVAMLLYEWLSPHG